MFLVTTGKEMRALGWDRLDIILVTGDTYIDSPFIGTAVIGRVLADAGFRVGIIAQPDMTSEGDITRLGEPCLFWGISGGSVDSMVANRTASGKRRRSDDYTPGGKNTRRPDRAVIAYANLIRQHFKNTVPLVLGGIEASLRRVAHYDFWSNRVRRSILFDARADYLVYGMGERAVVELAEALRDGTDTRAIRGLCYVAHEVPDDCLVLSSYRECAADKMVFEEMFKTFYLNNDPLTAKVLAQQQDSRFLLQNPPAMPLSTQELDLVHNLDYERDVHPWYAGHGEVRALATISFSLATHRGCYGECNFCAIAVHQGRTVRWRSRKSIVREARRIAAHPRFKGTIHDVGGPTANMYGFECERKLTKGACPKKRCLFPGICASMKIDHTPQLKLLRDLRQVPGVRKVVVASGIRYDMILADRKQGRTYLRELVRHHVSGQMKIAPEHSEKKVLDLMGKPGPDSLLKFREMFMTMTGREGLNQFLTYYMIAAYPGCNMEDMRQLKKFCRRNLKLLPRQAQIFTPTPSTFATLMYWTGRDPFTGEDVFVERSARGRERQKQVLVAQGGGRGGNKGQRKTGREKSGR